jgi:signal transduction histidine kinase
VSKKPSSKRAPLRQIDPTLGPLGQRTFPEVAGMLRSRVKPILRDWEKLVRRHVPPAGNVSFDEILDHLPQILSAMADALATDDPADVKRLMERSPEQGIHRFTLHYDTRELATEDRMLRMLIIEHVESGLGRRTSREEDAALNWAVDLMAQQAMVAFVNHQNDKLRAAAEAELQYLSFLSHDLSGNLGNVTLWLQVLKRQVAGFPELAGEVAALDNAQKAILDTLGGMGRLLQAERLRHKGDPPKPGMINLHALTSGVVRQFAAQAEQKGVGLDFDIPPDAEAHSEPELVTLVLQNLVGNAVKYSSRGTVRVSAEQQSNGRAGAWTVSVADEGPGIAPEQFTHIFEAFRRGEAHGQRGVGLGLTIAARAAKLLGAELTVESKPGTGSTFRLAFPPKPDAPGRGRRGSLRG